MKEETLRVLKMVEENKITAEKAAELLSAMGTTEEKNVVLSEGYKKRILKVKVDYKAGDKVNVNLPVSVINAVLKATGKLPLKINGLEGIDIESLTAIIVEAFENEVSGEIINVVSADGDTVKVVIE